MNDFLKNHCDGSGPHSGVENEVRVYPLGGNGNLIMCMACFARENRYRYERGVETKRPQDWPQVSFFKAEVYATETA